MKLPRLTATESLIMELLVAEHRELYGLELVKLSKEQLKRGSVYVLLSRLQDRGYIASRTATPPSGAGGKPRPIYRLTGLGERVIATHEIAAAYFQEQPRVTG